MRHRITLILLLLVAATHSFAYPRPVHSKISVFAFDQAAAESDFLQRYGWADIDGVLKGLVSYGADHQDDGINSLNHFYDPQANIPLTVKLGPTCNPVGVRAPDWALDWNRFDNPGGRKAAQHHFFQALTAPGRGDRTYSTFSLFEALGQMTHLVQDMAQPEHTRNDQHLIAVNATAPSLYENWTYNHLLSNFIAPNIPSRDVFEGYPTPSANVSDPHMYFKGDYGLATHASRNYVTQDTNYPDPVWCTVRPFPQRNERTAVVRMTVVNVTDPLTGVVTPTPVAEKIYRHNAYDYPTGQYDLDPAHTIAGLFDHEAEKYGKRAFSLDNSSWEARARNLVPKAVGYTAAMIRNFFRGKVKSHWMITNNNTYLIRMMDIDGDLFRDATVHVYRETQQGILEELAPPKQMTTVGFAAAAAEIPIPATEIYKHGVRVVVQGRLGSDQGAVAAHIIAPRHEVKIVVEYENGYTHQLTWFDVRTLSHADFTNTSTITIKSSTETKTARGIPFSDITPPPFSGTLVFKAGVLDNERFESTLLFEGVSEPSRNKTAFVTIYRDGQFVQTEQFQYTNRVAKRIRFDGTGAFTIINI